MVFDGDPMPRRQPFILAWALTILCCAYVTAIGTAIQGLVWALLALPTLAICLKPKYLGSYLRAFGTVVGIYAVMLIVELATGFQTPNPETQYRFFALTGAWGYLKASAWPMIDPNNAALVINCALIPCFWKALCKVKWFRLVTTLFAAALLCTSSKAGICVGLGTCGALAVYNSEERWPAASVLVALLIALGAAMTQLPMNDIVTAAHQRLGIWEGAMRVSDTSGFWGIGMGMFSAYYSQLKLESFSSGNWVHNDPFQIAIEMGQWAVLVFLLMYARMYWTTRRGNLPAAAVLTAILVQSMVEFQFYVPVISLLGGLALAYHSLKQEV